MLKIDLHCHTWYSRGEILKKEVFMSPYEVVKEAKRKGLNGIAITDHNVIKIKEFAKKISNEDFLVIIGEEIDTKEGHVLAIGIEEEIKKGLSLEETIELIHSQGGIAIAPHPFDLIKKGLREKAIKCDAIEVKNSLNIDRLSNFVAEVFAKKYNLNKVGGSDAHFKEAVGNCFTTLDCELEIDSIIKHIKKGKSSAEGRYIKVPELIEWYRERVLSCYDDVYYYINENYNIFKKEAAKVLLKIGESSKSKYFFTPLGYFGLACGIGYSVLRSLFLLGFKL